MAKDNFDFSIFDGIGSGGNAYSTLPLQILPDHEKTKSWRRACVDSLEIYGLSQIQEQLVFREWKAMAEGRFTYLGTGVSDFQELPWFDKEIRKLRNEAHIPTHIKHFDFIGIIVNAMASIYSDLDSRYRVDSIDEYSTNEYIRQRTELLHKYAQQVFQEEVNKMLLMRGIDPFKEDFESEEEEGQYREQIAQQTKALTPEEIEEFMGKNFKVLAVEWAQNILTADKKRFYLENKDLDDFVNFLLTGRYFRNYRVGYDSYYIESWLEEEVFFSGDLYLKYPQDAEFIGRITSMSIDSMMNRYGHLMTTKQQERIGNYWNQQKGNWDRYHNGAELDRKKLAPEDMAFPEPVQVPFHNYFDHQINLQFEDALGVPLAETTIVDEDGNEETFSTYIPREGDTSGFNSNDYSTYLRDDISVRRDTVRVTEGYWRSQKRLGVLIYENKYGSLSIELTTDDLLKDFLEEEEIKKLRSTSLNELQKALKNDKLEEFKNTITYIYTPEVWKFIKIKGNGSTINEDIYLDVKPLDFQIKGEDSNIYDVKLPVSGIIDTGMTPKIQPYQQLHNISMNQVTELLEKELGVFFSFDINTLGDEYQDETTEEALYRIRENIKDTGLLGLDLSKQHTGYNTPNLFQKQEVVFATQVQYRMELAERYKQEAFSQVGITPQVLGQPTTYETKEGVKTTANASYALLNRWFDKFNISKAKGMEIHLSVAQYCEKEGKEAHLMTRKGDGELRFLDILKEDEELFPLRHLSVHPETSSSDRKKVEQIKEFILNDNTIDRSLNDVISILTNPVLLEIQDKAKQMEKKQDQKVAEDRQFQNQQLQMKIESDEKESLLKHDRDKELENIKGTYDIKEAQIKALGSAAYKDADTQGYDEINEATQDAIQNSQKDRELDIKESDQQRKISADKEKRRIELAKLAQKSEELRLKNKSLDVQMTTSLINKN